VPKSPFGDRHVDPRQPSCAIRLWWPRRSGSSSGGRPNRSTSALRSDFVNDPRIQLSERPKAEALGNGRYRLNQGAPPITFSYALRHPGVQGSLSLPEIPGRSSFSLTRWERRQRTTQVSTSHKTLDDQYYEADGRWPMRRTIPYFLTADRPSPVRTSNAILRQSCAHLWNPQLLSESGGGWPSSRSRLAASLRRPSQWTFSPAMTAR
jgi:hypothetical protein